MSKCPPGTVAAVSSAAVDRRLRSARGAVFGAFTLNGFLLAMWVVHIPAITDRTGVSASLLGMFVLLLAGTAIVGMRLAGPAADRIGSRTLVAVAAAAISVTVLGPGLATGPVSLAVALACFGFGNGALDVSMNTQAVQVERAYGRPIMSAFHAMFSGGGFAGSLVGAATQRAGLSPQVTLTCAGVAGLVVTAVLVPHLVAHRRPGAVAEPGRPETGSHVERYEGETEGSVEGVVTGETAGAVRQRSGSREVTNHPSALMKPDRTRKVLSLGVIAFVLLLAEGVAGDWSALQAREHLGVADGAAALAFGAFSATMTLGRFLADRVSAAIGPVAIVRYGSLLCAAGFAVVIASPWLPLTLIGWALCGLGLAGGVPQIFTTAGNLGGSTAATDMSRVFTIGYLGLLAGPALIGWLTALIPLTAALTIPLVLTLACACAASIVAPPHPAVRHGDG
ncbi:MFS transporter [Nocardia halotolerans]|uniref:MFS transporter n=1 Tax=Nocardia halotolerans TaxID=1755878 RepID=A0ABV8VRU3_9NOCA